MEAEFAKIYNSRYIFNIFLVIFLANIFVNIDHGALPGCYKEVAIKLNMNEFQYGLLASFVFLGLCMGSFVSTAVFSKGQYIKPALIKT